MDYQKKFSSEKRLHTDTLEEKYGPISAKVLKHNDLVRECHLIDQKGISRTYTITFFPQNNKLNEKLGSIDQRVRSGELIGKAFRSSGYSVRRNILGVYTLKIPDWLRSAFTTNKRSAKVRMSEIYIKKGNSAPLVYGTVVEIMSPEFVGVTVNSSELSQVTAPTVVLEKIGFSKKEIWQKLKGV